MKKLFKCFSASFISLCVMLAFVSQYSADSSTIYVTDGYSYIINNYGLLSLCGWDNRSTNLDVPNTLNGKYVGEIESFGFRNNDIITSIDFSAPTKFDSIGTYSFESCESISGELVLPRKISFIGDAAFKDCSSIKSVKFIANTDTIPRLCFSGCMSLSNIEITAGAKEIEAYAFENCVSLNEITIPKTITTINSSAFNGCGEFVIKGYRDSYAQEYAKSKGIDFYILDPLYGDSNADGKVNILDVTAIQKYKIGEQELSEYGMRCADVNHDGSITVRDATLIQMKLAKYDVDF